jgi:hypothetical protein
LGGQQFPNFEAARAEAIRSARDIMADELKTNGHINLSHWIEIEDEDGDMTVVTFGDAVTFQASGP